MITSSLDTNQAIYIQEHHREQLFNHIYEEEKTCTDLKKLYEYEFSSEELEKYCSGKIWKDDYAYKHISKLLRKEYEEWKENKKQEE